MPRLTDDGRVSFGYGRYWFDPTRTILQDCSTGVCRIVLSDGTVLSERGNRIHLEGRNNLWVSQDAAGVYGSFGEFPGAAITSGPSPVAAELIGPDGSLIYKRSYQSAGPWFNTATGQEIPGDGDSWQNLGGGHWIARLGMEIQDETGHVWGRGWWPRWKDEYFLYQAETGELVLDDRIIWAVGNYFRPDFIVRDDGSFFVVWSPDESEATVLSRDLTVAELAACQLYAPPAPPRPIGPVSGARPADGRSYDLLAYLVGHPSTWPRKGPTHPMHQVIRGGLVYFVKFGDIAPGGEPHETWAFDANWLYHLEDASSGDPYSFTDQRMWPRRMAIGEAKAFDTGPHESVWRTRATCVESRREPFRRKMWLWAVYDRFYWGPDLGERATIVLVYDATAGIHAPGRNIELGYYALGAGSCRWESYRSEDVYRTGQAVFRESEVAMRSDFYRLGGPAVQPALLNCVPQVVPSYPPWESKPEPLERYQKIRAY